MLDRRSNRQHLARQDPPGDVQKSDSRPMTAGELAADSETEPEELASVDRALGRGQITCSRRSTPANENVPYLGKASCVPVSRACSKGGAEGGNT